MSSGHARGKGLAAVLAGILLGGALGLLAGQHAPPPPRFEPQPAAPAPPSARETTLLVMVSDAKGNSGRSSTNGNTDTLLLVHLDPGAHQVSALAIPRDTRAHIPGHGTFKVNAANAWGGPELAVRTVSQLLSVPIDRYLVFNLQGVRALVDAMGGLDVTVPKRVHYVDRAGGLYIDFQPGRQHMTGRQVEAYLRFRHDDAGDIGRVQRQQAFFLELAHQALATGQWLRLPALWAVLAEHARTDLTPFEVVGMVPLLRGLDPGRDLALTALPGRDDSTGGPWYWAANVQAVRPFLVEHFHAQLPAVEAPRAPRVTIANRTGLPGRSLEGLVASLQDEGFRVQDLFGAPEIERSKVIAERGDRQGAERLHDLMGQGEVVVAAIGATGSEFTLQVGRDWIARVSRR